MKKPKILVVGSFVMDQIGKTHVFPREGQTVFGDSFSVAPGGKGANQAVQMARLGADVTLIGKIGHDANGEAMLAVAREAGINTGHVLYDDAGPSGCSMIILEDKDSGQTANRILVIPGANMTITPEEVAFLEEDIAAYDLVVLQLEIPMEINELVVKYAVAKGVPVMLNSAPSAPLSDEILSGLAFISPNEHELLDITGIAIEHTGNDIDMDAAARAAQFLRQRGVKNILVTLGESGAVLATEDGELIHSPCMSGIHAVDPTAAGDSFVGALSVGLSAGWGYEEAMRFANCTAGLTVSAMGAMPSLPTLDMVTEDYMKRFDEVPDTSMLK